jgi:hypothetical protein
VSSTFANAGVSKRLYTLDLATGQATQVGPYGDPDILMHGLEIDSRTGTLYGVSSHDGGLYQVDRETGAATLIGLTGITGLGSFGALGYDSDNGVMFATNALTDSLYRINLASGAATLVGPLNGPVSIGALTYNLHNHTMYLVDNDADILYTIDLTTGAATPVGATGPGNLIGLVYVTGDCPEFCEGDVNGDGQVDLEDLAILLANFGAAGAGFEDGDLDGDGDVDLADLALLLARFGAVC